MSVVLLNEQEIDTTQNVIQKDGSSIGSVTQAIIGTQGSAFIEIKDGALRQYDETGSIRSEWLPSGIRQIYDDSGNVVIKEDPNG